MAPMSGWRERTAKFRMMSPQRQDHDLVSCSVLHRNPLLSVWSHEDGKVSRCFRLKAGSKKTKKKKESKVWTFLFSKVLLNVQFETADGENQRCLTCMPECGIMVVFFFFGRGSSGWLSLLRGMCEDLWRGQSARVAGLGGRRGKAGGGGGCSGCCWGGLWYVEEFVVVGFYRRVRGRIKCD